MFYTIKQGTISNQKPPVGDGVPLGDPPQPLLAILLAILCGFGRTWSLGWGIPRQLIRRMGERMGIWMKLSSLVGGLVAIFYFPIYWVSNHPNWLSYFSEGWPKTTNQKFECYDHAAWSALLTQTFVVCWKIISPIFTSMIYFFPAMCWWHRIWRECWTNSLFYPFCSGRIQRIIINYNP